MLKKKTHLGKKTDLVISFNLVEKTQYLKKLKIDHEIAAFVEKKKQTSPKDISLSIAYFQVESSPLKTKLFLQKDRLA